MEYSKNSLCDHYSSNVYERGQYFSGVWVVNTIERATETEEHERALAESWAKLGWTDELAQAKAEEVRLNYYNLAIKKK